MLYQQLSQFEHWITEISEDQQVIPSNLMPWLLKQGSLTTALIKLSNDNFKVVVKAETQTIAYANEQKKLNFELDQISLIREVELHIHDQAVVFARSIIPLALTNQQAGNLDTLGTKPLGHLLFKDGKPKSSRRDYAVIDDNDQTIYARRTPYVYQGHQVLVSEFFLPSFSMFI